MNKKTATTLFFLSALALPATSQDYILPMGYVTPWTGRVLFNSEGGYNGNYNNDGSAIHGWELLYEAQQGDTYTITMPSATGPQNYDYGRVEFKTPINTWVTHKYTLHAELTANKGVSVAFGLRENEDNNRTWESTMFRLTANQKYTLDLPDIDGDQIEDLKLALSFATGADNTTIKLENISLKDLTDDKELWVGTSYYNWCYYANSSGVRIPDMTIDGRQETLNWNKADFDDTMWQEAAMPIGSNGALPNIQTLWPGGDNTNYWIRRDFSLDNVNKTSRYMLHVLHDDTYWIYVNGQLVDQDNGWTDGTDNPRKIEIPASQLNAGNNVIATYIQQNWGGRSFDCGLTEEKDFYEAGDEDADLTRLIINEVQVGNIDQYIDYSYNYGGWIELYNPTKQDMTLRGLYVSDDPEKPKKFVLPLGFGTIKAGGFKTIFFDHNSADGTYGSTANKQVSFKLQNGGGTIYLNNSDGTNICSAEYPEAITRCSYARTTDGGSTWSWTGDPTPAATNATSNFADFRLEAPLVDTDSRLFTSAFPVSVTIPEGATLRYTTDGTAPTAENGMTSTDGRFQIKATTILRLRLIQKDWLPSPVVTRSYIYRDHDYYLPVISIATNPDNLYDDKIGVYVDGTNGVEGRNHGKSNINMDWERPVNFEYITPDGKMGFNQEAEFTISGGWSRHYAPASFKIKATNRYEGKKSLDYPFFPYKPYNKYRQILVRNGGNDNDNWRHGRVRDAITQQVLLSSGFQVDCQDYQPAHVFFNGSYIGLLNLREPNNRYHGYANYGYDDDKMDAFEYSNGYFQMAGTNTAFRKWRQLAQNSTNAATYEQLKQLMDLDEVVNYWAAITYIGCSDWICNNNNLKGYRSLPDGRFHLTVLDQDWGWSNSSGIQTVSSNYNNDMLSIFNHLMDNTDFRRRFIDAYCLLGGSVFTSERGKAIGDSICNLVEPALAWENGKTPWTSWGEQKAAMTGQSGRTARISALRSTYGLSSGMAVKFDANVPGAAFMLNGQPVPLGQFDGTLFAPVTLEVSAPAGYNFVGWTREGSTVQHLISKGGSWSYWDRGSLDGTNWKTGSISDWNSGLTPLGYGKNDIVTTISYGGNSSQKYPTYYFRQTVTLDENPANDASFVLNYTADDGFVVYVNGTETCRYLMPDGNISYSTYATTYAEGNPDSGSFQLDANLFRKGENIIAVEVHNNVPGSSDIYWNAELTCTSTLDANVVSRDRSLTLTDEVTTELHAIFSPLDEEYLVPAGSTPVVVNEVSAANSVFANEYGKRNDWIELYNTTDEDIDLEGMFVTDDPTNPEKYQISSFAIGEPAIIPAHGHFVLWADKLDALSQFHTGFKLGNNDGESVTLTAADHSWSDCLTYQTHDGGESVGRYPDGGKRTYRMTRPTIHGANVLTYYSEYLTGLDENFDEKAYLDAIQAPAMADSRQASSTEYYTIDGMKISTPQRGINIVRSVAADGSVVVKRVLVK